MLTYAFDLLVKIYEEEGHAPSEIPEKILTHNLFGLEICPRAAQLAQFALVCKAREQSRTAFRRPVQPQVMCLRDVVLTPDEVKGFTEATGVKFSQDELAQIHQFRENTETFGSLIQPVLDGEKLAALVAKIGGQAPAGDLLVQNTHRKLRLVLDQAEMLSQRYQAVVANPPYMGGGAMNPILKGYLGKAFPDGKADLYSAFLERNMSLVLAGGGFGMITIPNWMFLKSFEDLRVRLLRECHITSMIHNGRGVWGGDFGSCAFVVENYPIPSRKGVFRRLFKKQGEIQSNRELINNFRNADEYPIYHASSVDFGKIPGQPVAYWISESMRRVFSDNHPLADVAKVCEGMNTANNDLFLRFWQEVGFTKIGYGCTNRSDAKESNKVWFPYLKGGDYRKWYGNHSYVINWENDGQSIKSEKNDNGQTRANIRNPDYFFHDSIHWSYISASFFSARRSGGGLIFDGKSPSIFFEDLDLVIGLLNAKVTTVFLSIIDPTIKFSVGAVGRIPLLNVENQPCETNSIACDATRIARADWDNFETSWDFRDLPLLRSGDWEVEPGRPGGSWKGGTLAEAWTNYDNYCTAAIRRMQELETENNRLWIDAYGLQDELDPAVPEDEITLARADKAKDVAAFLSYAVGCMMGRYSLDQPGLILADAGDTVENYLAKVGKPLDQLQFPPDEDAIIPVLEGEWFEDDIVSRTREFLRVTFGEATLKENLRFIEESLGKALEKYFLTDFYKDHLQTYKKRPIYWLFQSPKKGFSALVYLHRYTRDTVNTLLNGYLRDYLKKLESRIEHLEHVQDTASSAREKSAAAKEEAKLKKTLKECREWERDVLLPLAQQRLEIDLDDGVKANYPKFGNALAKVAGLTK